MSCRAASSLALPAFLLLATLPALAAPDKAPPESTVYREITDYGEISRHRLDPTPWVTTPWEDITRDRRNAWWKFELWVDEQGTVTSARLKDGAGQQREEATRLAKAMRFKPFERDGQPILARLELHISSRAADYTGPVDRGFPADPDLSTTVIVLARTGCMGTCPDYRVELRGNGEVRYQGNSNVLVRGAHQWRVDPATLAPLLELLRQANYFALEGYYEYGITDFPTFITRVSIGERHKFVLDYAAAMVDAHGPDKDLPNMPVVVSEIEQAIDQVSGAVSYVSGDDATLPRLRAERWDFRSKEAGHGLRIALLRCKTGIAREFIQAGTPVDVSGDGYGGGPPIVHAAGCADAELARLMIARGALKDRSVAREFLRASVWNGQPDLVALALKYSRDVNRPGDGGATLLAQAAGSFVHDEDDPGAATFDSAKVVGMLIDAGAKLETRDDEGRTALFAANHPDVAAALLRRGANPNARDNYGRTPLFDEYFSEPKPALIAAGADVNARDENGQTPLFAQSDPDSIKLLLDAGADLNATDSKGLTAIERMNSVSATAALLAAGAKLPTDPARLKAMIARATEEKWTDVLPALEAAAARK